MSYLPTVQQLTRLRTPDNSAIAPSDLSVRGMEAEVFFHNSIIGNFTVCLDQLCPTRLGFRCNKSIVYSDNLSLF